MISKFVNILLIVAVIAFVSCSKGKSYTELRKAERNAIDRLIDSKGFEVLNDFPEDTIFKENQFVKLKNEVYLNIIDPGTNDRAVSGKTNVLYRCIVSYPMDSAYVFYTPYSVYAKDPHVAKSVNYGPNSNGTRPYEMLYRNPDDFYYGYEPSEYGYDSEALMSVLKYVGDGAKVKLIVPFKRGLYYDMKNGAPAFYEILQYKFEENL